MARPVGAKNNRLTLGSSRIYDPCGPATSSSIELILERGISDFIPPSPRMMRWEESFSTTLPLRLEPSLSVTRTVELSASALTRAEESICALAGDGSVTAKNANAKMMCDFMESIFHFKSKLRNNIHRFRHGQFPTLSKVSATLQSTFFHL